MIQIKRGVRLTGIVPQMVLASHVVDGVMLTFGIALCVITSANDGKHSATSLHYGREGKYTDGLCRACDYRTKYLGLDGREIELQNKVRAALGQDFDVIMEDIGSENEHLHVEYDPLG